MNFDPDLPNLGSSGKRGITIYVMDQIKVIEVEFLNDFEEQLWIRATLRGSDSLLIGCIYRSPSKDATVETNKLCDLLRQVIDTVPTHLLIAGDFNYSQINWTDWNSSGSDNHYTQNFIKTVQDCFLFQYVSRPTRYRQRNVPNPLDLILTNEDGMVNNVD